MGRPPRHKQGQWKPLRSKPTKETVAPTKKQIIEEAKRVLGTSEKVTKETKVTEAKSPVGE